ncbi:MAG: gliding motility-associated C-terminal domain-containing protein [Crocinitomicaceae bacterium]|nr:gliding motility-associated C-terminal domain-containing protein [Crocinitomicaceae bacterium]
MKRLLKNISIEGYFLTIGLLLMPIFGHSQTVTNGSVTGAPVGNNLIGPNCPNWNVCGFSPDLCDAGFPSYTGNSQVGASPSPDGGSWLGMASVGSGLGECAETTITGLTVGQQYTLCFWGSNFGTGSAYNGGPATPSVSVGGTSQSYSIPQVANVWNLYTLVFTATATTMPLQCNNPSGGVPSYANLDGFVISIPGATATWNNPSPLCAAQAPVNLNGYVTGTPGGVWSGTGVTGSNFDPAFGTQSVTYTVNPGGCDEVSVTQTITVTGTDASWTVPSPVCSNGSPINLDTYVTGTTGGTWSGTGVTGNMFDPSVGTQSITYSVGAFPCNASSAQTITVTTAGDPTWTLPSGLCASSAQVDLNTLITGTAGGTWSGTGVTGNMFDPSGGSQTVTYTVGSAPCQGISSQLINVGSAADATWTNPGPLCSTGSAINLDTYVTGTAGGTWSGTGVTGNMFDPANGTQTVTYSVGTAPCNDALSLSINVVSNADASWTIPTGLCDSGSPIDLSTFVTGTTGGTFSGTGISGNMFDPSVGTQSITYTVGTAPCNDVVTQTITVGTQADATWSAPTGLCTASPQVDLSTLITGTTGGTFSGTGISGNMFDPSVGTQSITYTVGTAPCDDQLALTINVATLPSGAWTVPVGLCLGDSPIDLSTFITGASGGTWSGTGITGSMFDPSVGTQSITYTTGTAPCTDAVTQTITVAALYDPAWTIPANICESDAPFDLSTFITGDVGGTWSGTGVSGTNFDPSAGTQSITYTIGSGGCQDQLTQTITVTPASDPSWTTTMLCTSSTPINLDNLITGDTGGSWSGTGVTGNVFDPTNGTQTVTYSITSGACTATSTQSISVVDPQVSASGTAASCFGQSNGTASATVSGGSGNYTYSWNTTPVQTTSNASNLAAGSYTVTVTDVDGGCTVTADVTIIEPSQIQLVLTPTNVCAPLLGSASVTASGGVGGFTYNWSPVVSTDSIATGIDSAMATVVVTDGNGCTATDSVFVTVYPQPVVTTSMDTTIYWGDFAMLSATGGVSYNWTPNDELSCDDCASPIASPDVATQYCVTVTDANGCVNEACTWVYIEIVCGEVFVPSAFSPNNDGENDVLCVYTDCYEQLTFTIYNRWGEAVFESSSENICWDGTWKGKELNSAVFVYTLDGRLVNGQTVSKKGNISLIK